MQKLLRLLISITLALGLILAGSPAYTASVQITLPSFSVTLNGIRVENATRQYPLIVYKDITYFPMTYYDCRFLGLESNYTSQTGLDIQKTSIGGDYHDYKMTGKNPQRATAQTAVFPIRVNGKTVDNSKEEYPLLLYKNITYFPLTWRFAVDEFGWDYYFNNANKTGLVINSTRPEPVALPPPEQIADLVSDSKAKLNDSEWLSMILRAYSRYENRVWGLFNEHRPSNIKWYRTVDMTGAVNNDNAANPHVTEHYLEREGRFYTSSNGTKWSLKNKEDFDSFSSMSFNRLDDVLAALERLPKDALANAWVNTDERYSCLVLSYIDEKPLSMPEEAPDGGISAGHLSSHTFNIDIQERCLRSYWSSTVPFYWFGDDGEPEPFAPSTTFYNVIDFDYKPFVIPTP